MTPTIAPSSFRRVSTLLAPAAILTVVLLMVVPLPPFLLDLLLSVDIGLAVVLLQRYCAEATRRLQDILRCPGTPRQRLEQFLHLRDPECTDPFWRCMLDRGCFA